MRRVLGWYAWAITLLLVPPAVAQEQETTVLAHRVAADFVEVLNLEQLVGRVFTSDYPDLPSCADLQLQSLQAELPEARRIMVGVIESSMTTSYTHDELAAGARFLEGPAGREVIAAGYAAKEGRTMTLSPPAQREARIMASLPEFRTFIAKFTETPFFSGTEFADRMKREVDPEWKRRFEQMAKAKSVVCPQREW